MTPATKQHLLRVASASAVVGATWLIALGTVQIAHAGSIGAPPGGWDDPTVGNFNPGGAVYDRGGLGWDGHESPDDEHPGAWCNHKGSIAIALRCYLARQEAENEVPVRPKPRPPVFPPVVPETPLEPPAEPDVPPVSPPPAPVPLPASLPLLAGTLAGLTLLRRFSR